MSVSWPTAYFNRTFKSNLFLGVQNQLNERRKPTLFKIKVHHKILQQKTMTYARTAYLGQTCIGTQYYIMCQSVTQKNHFKYHHAWASFHTSTNPPVRCQWTRWRGGWHWVAGLPHLLSFNKGGRWWRCWGMNFRNFLPGHWVGDRWMSCHLWFLMVHLLVDVRLRHLLHYDLSAVFALYKQT